jgi:branched-subunit amino acid transport protein
MEVSLTFLWILLGVSLVTWLPRVLPLVLLSKVKLPDWSMRFLSHIPVAVMSALVAQELLTTEGEFTLFTDPLKIAALIPTLIIAVLTKSLLATVIAGIISMMVIQYFF